jgi:large subunit ribosomal protein L6
MSSRTKGAKVEGSISELKFPETVSISENQNIVTVSGNMGTTKKDFTRLPATINIRDKTIFIKTHGNRKKDLAIMNTTKSIINNMIIGVEKGFTYKLKIIFAHFPITVRLKGKEVHVENFFGERSPRISKIVGEGTKVSVISDDIIVQGPSLEDVSQTAANIESSTRVKGKDQRVFLDGIYIYSTHVGL